MRVATHGVRIARGIVTHWHDEPITSYEMACRCLDMIERTTGERGEVEQIVASIPFGSVPAGQLGERETPA